VLERKGAGLLKTLLKKELMIQKITKKKFLILCMLVLPIVALVWTRGESSIVPAEYLFSFCPVFFGIILSSAFAEDALDSEASSKMLDVQLAMRVSPISIILSKALVASLIPFPPSVFMAIVINVSFYVSYGTVSIIGIDAVYILLLAISSLFAILSSMLLSVELQKGSMVPLVKTACPLLIIAILVSFASSMGISIYPDGEIPLSVFLVLAGISLVWVMASRLVRLTRFK
jgi:hypothetical protein